MFGPEATLAQWRHDPLTWQVRAYRDPAGNVCAALYVRYDGEKRGPRRWIKKGQSTCNWRQTTDGSGWVAAGVMTSLDLGKGDEKAFFGVVPDTAVTLRFTFPDGTTRQVATIARGGWPNRFFVLTVPASTPRGSVKISALDPQGRPLHVY
jgi:hypothetical protein